MKSARFLLIALLLSVWGVVGCASSAYHQRPEKIARISGFVLDSASRKPVPQVLVQSDTDQVLTDSMGHFAFTSTDRIGLYAGMSIAVHTVYYDGWLVLRAGQGKAYDSLTILLHRNRYRFKSVETCATSDSVSIHPYATPNLFNWCPGRQVTLLIKHKASTAADTLSTISFYGSNSSSSYPSSYVMASFNPFRLRIYQIDAGSLRPAGDLLTDNVVLCFPEIGETHTFNLRQYKVALPPGDFAIGLEPLVQGDKFYVCPPMLEHYHPSGVVLRPPCVFADTRTWESIADTDWHRLPPAQNCWPVYENMVSVEVEPAPAKR